MTRSGTFGLVTKKGSDAGANIVQSHYLPASAFTKLIENGTGAGVSFCSSATKST